MLEVQINEKNVNVRFSKNLIDDKDLKEFLEKVRVKELISKSQLTEEDLEILDNELKSEWWKKNREKFLDRI